MNRPLQLSLLAALIGLAIVGCNRPGSRRQKKPVIGVSLLAQDAFFEKMAEGFREHGRKADYQVIVTWADSDAKRQQAQVDDFLKRGVAAIVLCPVDRTVADSVRRANAQSIPVFTADIALLADGVNVVCHVATDNYRGGQLAADAMHRALKGSGRVAVIDHPSVDSVILRVRGFRQRLAELRKKHGSKVEFVHGGGPAGRRGRWFSSAQDVLQKEPEIDGIFAITDALALQAVEALKAANKLQEVAVVGFDGQPDALLAVTTGELAADVLQQPRRIAQMVVQAIDDYRAEIDVPATQLIAPALTPAYGSTARLILRPLTLKGAARRSSSLNQR